MNWKQRYIVRSYLRSSLWIIPVAAGVVERVFRLIVEALEGRLGWVDTGLGSKAQRHSPARSSR